MATCTRVQRHEEEKVGHEEKEEGISRWIVFSAVFPGAADFIRSGRGIRFVGPFTLEFEFRGSRSVSSSSEDARNARHAKEGFWGSTADAVASSLAV
jgi:hypothetical protein